MSPHEAHRWETAGGQVAKVLHGMKNDSLFVLLPIPPSVSQIQWGRKTLTKRAAIII
jgi:hypothetical protein